MSATSLSSVPKALDNASSLWLKYISKKSEIKATNLELIDSWTAEEENKDQKRLTASGCKVHAELEAKCKQRRKTINTILK